MVGDPFEPELAAAAAGDRRGGRRSTRSTSCCGSISSARPTCPGAFASGTRSSGAPSTSRRPAAGAWARTSARASARRARSTGAPSAPTTSSARRAGRRGCRRGYSVRPARRPPAAPASAARWFAPHCGSCPRRARRRRVELLLARARALAATGQFAEGHAALLESIRLVPAEAVALRVRLTTACARRRAPPRPPRAGARPPRPTALDELADAGSRRGVDADDRARDRQLLPHGLRADARLGERAVEPPRRSATRHVAAAPPCSRSPVRLGGATDEAQAHRARRPHSSTAPA